MKQVHKINHSFIVLVPAILTLLLLLLLAPPIKAINSAQTSSVPLDQIIIPVNGTSINSNINLENGIPYSIVITGTYRYDEGEPGEFADAQYREDDNDQWSIRYNSVEFDGVRLTADVFDLANHTYTFYVTGKGQVMTFRIYDDDYHDNQGSLNATIYSKPCTAPYGGRPQLIRITDIGTCGPNGKKTPRWDYFGYRQVLESMTGEKLEIECVNAAFVLYYTPPEGSRTQVGMCPFEGGYNTPSFTFIDSDQNDNKPDCFVSTRWISRDYSYNDGGEVFQGTGFPYEQNLWTGEKPESPELLDWADTIFDVNSNHTSKWDTKWTYLGGTPYVSIPPMSRAEGSYVSSSLVNPPIWPESLGIISGELQSLIEPAPMEEWLFDFCDFDIDGDCDEFDFQIFQGTLNACRDDANYDPIADIDGDGCVTVSDQLYLFPKQYYLPFVYKGLP